MVSSLGSVLTALIPGAGMLLAESVRGKQDSEEAFRYLIQLGIWGGVLLLMIILATLVVRRLRESATQSRQSGKDMLSNFQEMKQEGDISDAEFRNIKAVLGNELRSNVKSGKKTL